MGRPRKNWSSLSKRSKRRRVDVALERESSTECELFNPNLTFVLSQSLAASEVLEDCPPNPCGATTLEAVSRGDRG